MKGTFLSIEAEGDAVKPALETAGKLIAAVRARNDERAASQLALPLNQPRRRHPVTDTARQAGDRATRTTYTMQLRERLLAAIRAARGGLTADEAAREIAEDRDLKAVMNVRRRVSDLAKRGEIVETVFRRPNRDGNNQIVWRAAGGSNG